MSSWENLRFCFKAWASSTCFSLKRLARELTVPTTTFKVAPSVGRSSQIYAFLFQCHFQRLWCLSVFPKFFCKSPSWTHLMCVLCHGLLHSYDSPNSATFFCCFGGKVRNNCSVFLLLDLDALMLKAFCFHRQTKSASNLFISCCFGSCFNNLKFENNCVTQYVWI